MWIPIGQIMLQRAQRVQESYTSSTDSCRSFMVMSGITRRLTQRIGLISRRYTVRINSNLRAGVYLGSPEETRKWQASAHIPQWMQPSSSAAMSQVVFSMKTFLARAMRSESGRSTGLASVPSSFTIPMNIWNVCSISWFMLMP